MENIKIKSTKPVFHGTTVNLPIDGEVFIEADGSLSVSKECAKILEGHPDFEIAVKKQAEDENPLSKESLNKLSLEDLKAILETSGVDEASYAKFLKNKALLIKFIIKTIE